jgi:hypothetical protein
MTNLTRWSLVLAAAALMGGACGGSKLGGTGGTGGTTGYGGFFETGGIVGTGGFGTGGFATGGFGDGLGGNGFGGEFGTGGFGGTWGTGGDYGFGGYFGTGGNYGTGGIFPDGGTCTASTQGPISTWDSPRPFGWTYSGPTMGAGGAPATADGGTAATGDGGAAAAADGGAKVTGPATCQTIPAAYPGTSCEGTATLEALSSGTVIAFADGAKLTWDGTLPSALMPYVVAGATPDTVWVHYQEKYTVVCPFCGAYTTRTLEIRKGDPTGKVRFFDQQGDVLPNLTASQVMDIFGTTATPIFTCTFPYYAGCSSYLRSEFDQALGTTPPQTVVDATLTKVTTPNGIFQVIWASSVESYVETQTGCSDGPGVASDTGFVASLLAP